MLNSIKGKLVVSCQALQNEPLYGGDTMLKMAKAAIEGGGVAIRTNGGHNTKIIKNELDVPVIGLVKKEYPNTEVYITPTPTEVDEVCAAGCDMVALEATDRSRFFPLKELVEYTRQHYPKVKLLADISTYEEALTAQELGFDAIAITMSGYTEASKNRPSPDFDLLDVLIKEMNVPVIAEGNFNTPELARKAMRMGAHCVIVGSAISRPQLITKTFSEAILDV